MCVSIIIPSFRPDEDLFRCLDSLDFQVTPEMEVIVVLNGDKDPFFTWVSPYLARKSYPSKLLFTPRSSASHARNVGMDAAEKDYYFFLDDDDFITSRYIENLISLKGERTIVVGNSISFDQKGNLYSNYITRLFARSGQTLMTNRGFYSNATGKLIPRKVVSGKRFDEDILIGEDALFMARLSGCNPCIVRSKPDEYYCVRLRQDLRKWRYKSRRWRVYNGARTISKYLSLLLKQGYNKGFILTRIAATIRNLLFNRYTPLTQIDGDLDTLVSKTR